MNARHGVAELARVPAPFADGNSGRCTDLVLALAESFLLLRGRWLHRNRKYAPPPPMPPPPNPPVRRPGKNWIPPVLPAPARSGDVTISIALAAEEPQPFRSDRLAVARNQDVAAGREPFRRLGNVDLRAGRRRHRHVLQLLQFDRSGAAADPLDDLRTAGRHARSSGAPRSGSARPWRRRTAWPECAPLPSASAFTKKSRGAGPVGAATASVSLASRPGTAASRDCRTQIRQQHERKQQSATHGIRLLESLPGFDRNGRHRCVPSETRISSPTVKSNGPSRAARSARRRRRPSSGASRRRG